MTIPSPRPNSPAPSRQKDRIVDRLGNLWAGAARHLLVLFIVGHHTLLLVVLLRSAEEAWRLVASHEAGDWREGWRWAAAGGLATLALLVLLRLKSALFGLVTSSHDASDQEVNGTKLNRQEHPALFELVEEVARRVGTAPPDEIWVTADARCFSFEQRGFGVLTQRRLVLVLGLPQLLIFTAAELRVIVAHELAHVRQNDTTLAVFLFRFAESLRRYLERSSQHPLGWLNPLAWFERASYGLFQVLIAPVVRRQEIRADCISAELYGADLARRTLLKDWLVTSQFTAIVEQRLDDSRAGKTQDQRSVHQQFLEEWRQVSPSGCDYLEQRLHELEHESYWDTHPSLSSRLRAVAAYPNIGYDERKPAIELLGDRASLLKSLGEEMASDLQLQPVAALSP